LRQTADDKEIAFVLAIFPLRLISKIAKNQKYSADFRLLGVLPVLQEYQEQKDVRYVFAM